MADSVQNFEINSEQSRRFLLRLHLALSVLSSTEQIICRSCKHLFHDVRGTDSRPEGSVMQNDLKSVKSLEPFSSLRHFFHTNMSF